MSSAHSLIRLHFVMEQYEFLVSSGYRPLIVSTYMLHHCTPETGVRLYADYTSVKLFEIKKR